MFEQLFSNPERVLPRFTTSPKLVQVIISTTCSVLKLTIEKRLPIFTGRESRLENTPTDVVVPSFVKIPGIIVSCLISIGEAFVPSTAVQQLNKLQCAFEFAILGMAGKLAAQEDSVWDICLANGPVLEERHVLDQLRKRFECQSGSNVEGVLEMLFVVIVNSFLYKSMD